MIQAVKGPRKPTPLRLTFAGFKVNRLECGEREEGRPADGSHHVSPTRPGAVCSLSL